MTDTANLLRGEVTHRLAPYLPPHLVTAAGESAAVWLDDAERCGLIANGDLSAREAIRFVRGAVLKALPPPYREIGDVAQAIGEAAAAWWASHVVEVRARRATVTDHRG